MRKLLRSLLPVRLARESESNATAATGKPPSIVFVEGGGTFPLAEHISQSNGLPIVDWAAVEAWVSSIQVAEVQTLAWGTCERVWLQHFQAALGPSYRLVEDGEAVLLSTLEPNVARATLEFMGKTLQRIVRLLDGVAHVPEWGKDILVVFDDDDAYYSYVAHYYPEQGEFAGSSGMYVNAGCAHFVTVKSDLRAIEPVIAHELTHGCVAHLPLPAWLNEGIAVNMEHRLSPSGQPMFTPQQMHDQHLRFWGDEEIQEFWSGQSFLRNDDGCMLSYDLARIIVAQMSSDWPTFQSFVLAADLRDGGAAAAREHLGVELGAYASALLERTPSSTWAPKPALWKSEPERGAFLCAARVER